MSKQAQPRPVRLPIMDEDDMPVIKPLRGRHQDRSGGVRQPKKIGQHWRQECREADELEREKKMAELIRRAANGLPLFDEDKKP